VAELEIHTTTPKMILITPKKILRGKTQYFSTIKINISLHFADELASAGFSIDY